MDQLSSILLLELTLGLYVVGAVGGLAAGRQPRAANAIASGCAALAGVFGILASINVLTGGSGQGSVSFELWSTGVPYVRPSVRVDALAAFFVLIVSFVGLCLSVFSLGYLRSFYGRKN